MTPREAIVQLMQSVPEIGIVQNRERHAHDVAKLKQLYAWGPSNQIRGWFVRRVRVRETGIAVPRYLEVVGWQIRGFIAFDDDGASELVLESLVEQLRDLFRANPTLLDTVTKLGLLPGNSDRGLQMEDAGPVLFAGVLCNAVRLSLTTTTERSQ